MTHDPDPRTAADDDEKIASNEQPNSGVSSPDPTEGRDDVPTGDDGSPRK